MVTAPHATRSCVRFCSPLEPVHVRPPIRLTSHAIQPMKEFAWCVRCFRAMVQCKGGRARRVVPMLVASLSFAAAGLGASGSARAAIISARRRHCRRARRHKPGIQALIRSVDARIGEQPKAMARVHTGARCRTKASTTRVPPR